jgi:hypothetical protein
VRNKEYVRTVSPILHLGADLADVESHPAGSFSICALFPEREKLYKHDEWINGGDAVVISPTGAVAAGPFTRQKAILYAETDRRRPAARGACSTSAAIMPGPTSSHSP